MSDDEKRREDSPDVKKAKKPGHTEEHETVKEPLDPFSPEALRLNQDFAAELGVKKLVTTVPVGRPPRSAFFQVRAGEEHRLQTAILDLKDQREVYLVAPSLWGSLSGELVRVVIFMYVTHQRVVGLWPVRLPDDQGKLDPWNRSKLEAARLAESRWVRLRSNMALGAYEILVAENNDEEPTWPKDLGLEETIKIAFKDNRIDDLGHPVLRALRGDF